MQPKIVDGRLVIDDELRAAHKADAQRITAKMHLLADESTGNLPCLLCGRSVPLPKEECMFVSDPQDELSRILWENFPNRCAECVWIDKSKFAS